MKVLICHNAYQFSGGEDTVVQAEYELLARAGHSVRRYIVSNEAITGRLSKIRVGLAAPYSRRSRCDLHRYLRRFRPDIVHFHNIFPLLTASVLDACEALDIPVVQTLHNYRYLCPNGLLFRDGKLCELCVSGTPYQAVRHSCYRQSAIESLAVARMVAIHRRRGTWGQKVDRYIAPTQFARSRFLAAGFPADKVCVKPHFTVDAPACEEADRIESGRAALYVGRLSAEKGLAILCRAFSQSRIPIKLIGGGFLDEPSNRAVPEHIVLAGILGRDEIYREMRAARFLVMPSEVYESFGMVIIEAFSQRLPVLCSDHGAMAELVTDGVTGLHFQAGNAEDLARKAQWLYDNPEACLSMGEVAFSEHKKKYTPEVNYLRLTEIYSEVIGERRARRIKGLAKIASGTR